MQEQERTTLLEFPSEFAIKIMGINHEDLIPEVIAIVSAHSSTFNPEGNIVTRLSKEGKYLSITATINAQSQQQLDDIYRALNKHELVKITL